MKHGKIVEVLIKAHKENLSFSDIATAIEQLEPEGEDDILNELISIHRYMDEKSAIYGFGQIGDLITKLQSTPQQPSVEPEGEVKYCPVKNRLFCVYWNEYEHGCGDCELQPPQQPSEGEILEILTNCFENGDFDLILHLDRAAKAIKELTQKR